MTELARLDTPVEARIESSSECELELELDLLLIGFLCSGILFVFLFFLVVYVRPNDHQSAV